MKKKLLLLFILFIPFIVKAEDPITLTYELCKSGCEYSDINTIFADIKEVDNTKLYDFIININDSATYDVDSSNCKIKFEDRKKINNSSITIKGINNNHPTIKYYGEESCYTGAVLKKIYLEELDIISSIELSIISTTAAEVDESTRETIIKNCNFKANRIGVSSTYNTIENSSIDVSVSFYTFNDYRVTNNSSGHGITKIINSNIKSKNGVTLNGPHEISSSTLDADGKISISSFTMNNSTINGNLESSGEVLLNDTIINGRMKIVPTHFEFDNIEISDGLAITKNYCSGRDDPPAIPGINTIKNSKISNKYGNAILIELREEIKIKIDNTDLDNSSCSINTTKKNKTQCTLANEQTPQIFPMFLNNELNDSEIEISNSKVNCAYTGSNDNTIGAKNMYFDHTNTWTKPIKRINGLPSESEISNYSTVSENNNGKIFIELGNEDTLYLNIDKDKDINEYFKNIIPEGSVLGEWLIEDNSIVKVVDGKVIPLKVGTTKISAVIDNNVYSVFLTVEEKDIQDTQNPNTGNLMNVIIVITILSIISVIILIKNAKEIKEY